jgi:hypothetical protein
MFSKSYASTTIYSGLVSTPPLESVVHGRFGTSQNSLYTVPDKMFASQLHRV